MSENPLPAALPPSSMPPSSSTEPAAHHGPTALPSTATAVPAPAALLTPEEQMAAFEKELKETDWGHQPC